MKTVFILFIHAIVTIAKLLRRGGAKSLIAENLAVRHQLINTAGFSLRRERESPGPRDLCQLRSPLHRQHIYGRV